MKIELDPFAGNEEKLQNIAEYLEQLKGHLVVISMDYDEEEEEVSDLLGDALETMDDLIDIVNEAAEAVR